MSVPTQAVTVQDALADVRRELFVGGEWRPSSEGTTFAVEDPSTGRPLADVASAGPRDGIAALDAGEAAGPGWAGSSPRARADVLRRAYELTVERQELLATLITLEMGKPLAESRGEVLYAADYLRWYAEEAVRLDGRFVTAPTGDSRIVVTHAPVGATLLITPWNFPIATGLRKLAPALAAGCTATVKPAEQTPLTMLACARILQAAGLPQGVLSVLPTGRPAELVDAMIGDGRLRKLSFTGSTKVGRALAATSGDRLLRVSLELGGNAPFVVFDDADLGAAVEGAIVAKMRNGGQACTAANRFLVQATVADAFATKLADRLRAMRPGSGFDEVSDVGPLIDDRQRQKVAGLVDEALALGARARAGGAAVVGDGYFYEPTVLVDVPATAAIVNEEVFGPVATVLTFEDEAEAVALANDTEYGLVAYVYTSSLDRGLRMVDALDTGMVGVNRGLVANAAAPFGGVKASGYGREGGPEGIAEYLAPKYAAIDNH